MDGVVTNPQPNASRCSITIFTQQWKEVRDFYVEILRAVVSSECTEQYCELCLGGIPITVRLAENNETVSYLHLYLSMQNRTPLLHELQRRGIITTIAGPYMNFRDPDGRIIKVSEHAAIIS